MSHDVPSGDSLIRLGDVSLWAETALDAINRLVIREEASERVAFADITEDVVVARHLAHGDQMSVVWAAHHLVTSYERLKKPVRDQLGVSPTGLQETVKHLRDVF